MTIAAIIVAAGRGTRAGGPIPKQWQLLDGRTILSRTVERFSQCDHCVLVLHPDDFDRATEFKNCILVAGGATRSESVLAGLNALRDIAPHKVLIHDAARPLTPQRVIDDVITALDIHDGAAPAMAVTDALWRGVDGIVTDTQDRSGLYRAQTPQGFIYSAILNAHETATQDAADDVEIARLAGIDVCITQGDEANMKITTPDDFARAEMILRTKMDIRTGNGYDVHAFEDGDHVWLCGVKIPHTKKLKGHSDADVGMHAVTDAIYGALGDGDIGQHFPPTDPQWKGAASHIFLEHACALARERGFTITHVDCTLICERPKIGPHGPTMKAEMARIMGLDPDRVSVKATTSERLGFTGREEGIASIATATLVKL